MCSTLPWAVRLPVLAQDARDLLADGDARRLTMLYADGAEIVRYDGVADTTEAIAEYYRNYLDRHPGIKLNQIDAFRRAGDVLLWDAVLDSDAGVLQTVEVMILDDDGRISRHIPGFRGYWGR